MPIWGLKTVAQVIATGFEGPQHCDEPWPYQFVVRTIFFITSCTEFLMLFETNIYSLANKCLSTCAGRADIQSGFRHAL